MALAVRPQGMGYFGVDSFLLRVARPRFQHAPHARMIFGRSAHTRVVSCSTPIHIGRLRERSRTTAILKSQL